MIPNQKLLSLCIVTLFFSVTISGCLEQDGDNKITENDVIVNPQVMIAGEFQSLVITAKRDISVFIPHMVIDPVSNYVQNGTIIDMRTGETKQLTILAPPRIDTAYIFLSKYGTEVWPIRYPSESWHDWVGRGGTNGESLAISRVDPGEGASLFTINLTKETVLKIRYEMKEVL